MSRIWYVTALLWLLTAGAAHAEPAWRHALTMYGEPKYAADFKHFDYVNPSAPKGGEVRLAALSSFDSLNPFIVKGVKAPAMSNMFETLLTESLDEPQAFYGLLAEAVRVAEDYSWVEFRMNPKARWHDGTKVTVEDVIFSLETLKTKGDPSLQIVLKTIEKAEKTGADTVKFTFAIKGNREVPLIAAGIPILSKAYYATHDFTQTTLESPLLSGAYRVKAVDQGRSIIYERVPDYWGKDLPVNVGQNNFELIRHDVYRDETVALEALKAGEYDFREEYIAKNWATAYNSPAIDKGLLIKRGIRHQIPSGMQAFIFNTRRAKFTDSRVREAIDLTMDFEWVNKTLFYSAYARNTSFFQNTPFAATELPAKDELAILEPLRDKLPTAVFTERYSPPITDGSGNNRANLLKADALLKAAGWIIKDGKRVHQQTGEVMTLEFLLHQPTFERVVAPMRKHLKRLGIDATIRIVDDAQYQRRIDDADFDIISIWINRGLFFPGSEQMSFWHSSQADIKGSNNIGGIKNPAIDAILAKLTSAPDLPALTAAGRALDRTLLFEHYVIPHWHHTLFRAAYWDKFGIPAITPKYNVGFGAWWIDEKKAQKLKKSKP